MKTDREMFQQKVEGVSWFAMKQMEEISSEEKGGMDSQ